MMLMVQYILHPGIIIQILIKLIIHLVRKDIDVNEYERLSNITPRHKLK